MCLAASGCTAPAPPPLPPVAKPAPKQVPNPTPEPVTLDPAPSFTNWMDAPVTPGDWSYTAEARGGLAQFGVAGAAPLLWMRCDRARGTVTLSRAGTAPAAVPVRIITETETRLLNGLPQRDGTAALTVTLPAASSFLDAIAFSKGRFAFETPGLPTLYVPSWPEVTRVIEDCR